MLRTVLVCENNGDAGVVRVFQNTEKAGIHQVLEHTEDAPDVHCPKVFQVMKNIARVGIIQVFEIQLMQGYARYLGIIADPGINEVFEETEDAVKCVGEFEG